MKEAFELAAAIIAGLGGGGAIVWALSSLIGKVWANKILEKEKAEYAKDIEYYKSELNKEVQRINAIQDKALYISKAQYDNEYHIYQEIWEKMNECILITKMLYPTFENRPVDKDECEKYQEEKLKRYRMVFKDYLLIIDRFAPFYKKEFYDYFISVRDKCNEIGNIFNTYEFEVKYSLTYAMARDSRMTVEEYKKVYTTLPSEIDDIKNKLQEEIREYLLSLQLVE